MDKIKVVQQCCIIVILIRKSNFIAVIDTHLLIEPQIRFKYLLDHGYEVIEYEAKLHDPLSFKSIKSYKELYEEARVRQIYPIHF